MSATVYALPVPGLQNIATVLRNIADEMDSGAYGDVSEGAIVLGSGSGVEVFGLGGGVDGTVTHFLLARGQRKLERIDLL